MTRSPATDLTAEGRITAFETFPINQSLMRTDGIDANLRYSVDLGDWGAFALQAGYPCAEDGSGAVRRGQAGGRDE
ncbi:hypothetical protein [Xanthomonas fragariae]|uniref:hypothetical protein n=1 Tax=Xanthomonas fragariae TaxID=48664 RepID=UPI0022AA998F|nr:hypothetical protein [Xanthomonas fragariae]WAT14437.1 hypothetical protein OZ429_15675 [Xanthomonas fragariae]